MHMGRKCYRHLWLLSGTGDGPVLAKELILKGWKVSVSVVSREASSAYSQIPLQNLWVGALEGVESIRANLKKSRESHFGFDWVIDATHPFAQVISPNLKTVCKEFDQPLLRFERFIQTSEEAILIQSYKDLLNFNLTGERVLFAIGSKFLPEAIEYALIAGAIPFARVLPSIQGLSKALCSKMPQNHAAVLKPLQGNPLGEIEASLCKQWRITGIVARESGGPTQALWQKIASQQKLNLFLISRPSPLDYICVVNTYSDLFNFLELNNH
ncbi:Cobalt-precorrin-6x reductase [Prochlorococcus sp. MIT 0603]|nr:Cobalt-precorrin-6x reductase [Prochlorococcus sp. MIT 0603]